MKAAAVNSSGTDNRPRKRARHGKRQPRIPHTKFCDTFAPLFCCATFTKCVLSCSVCLVNDSLATVTDCFAWQHKRAAMPAYPMRRSAAFTVFSDSGRSRLRTPGKTSRPSPVNGFNSARIDTACVENGITCGTLAFMRAFGMRHSNFSRSISA